MSTTIVFDQHPVFFLQTSYSMAIYAHVLLGVLAILLLWFGLTLAFVKPPVLEVPSKRPPMPLRSGSSTIVVNTLPKDGPSKGMILTDAVLTEEPESILPFHEELPPSTFVTTDDSSDFITFTNPFADVDAPVKVSKSPSLALYPFVRRMSMRKHRPSFRIPPSSPNAVTSLRSRARVYRHGSLADDDVSYLPPPHVPSGKVRLIPDDDDKDERAKCPPPVSESNTTTTDVPAAVASPSKKFRLPVMKLKRVTKRVRGLFHRSRRS